MITLQIPIEQTRDEDIALYADSGFPLVYCGRGSYTSKLCLCAFFDEQATKMSHLVYIGRYTSIGDNVEIFGDINHDYTSVYMGLILDYGTENGVDVRSKVGQNYKGLPHKGMCVIGNDVWIGQDTKIMAGITIGNGAVIAAGSVVTRDIPPYTIWGGNPAHQIKERFPKEIAKKLQQIAWWEFSKEKIIEIKDLMQGKVDKFVDVMDLETIQDLPAVKTGGIIEFLDSETDFSCFSDVIEAYCMNSGIQNKKFTLYYHVDIAKEVEVVDSIRELLEQISSKLDFSFEGISISEDEKVISQADYLVLGRDKVNILRISYAMKHGTKLISGSDDPIFHELT